MEVDQDMFQSNFLKVFVRYITDQVLFEDFVENNNNIFSRISNCFQVFKNFFEYLKRRTQGRTVYYFQQSAGGSNRWSVRKKLRFWRAFLIVWKCQKIVFLNYRICFAGREGRVGGAERSGDPRPSYGLPTRFVAPP